MSSTNIISASSTTTKKGSKKRAAPTAAIPASPTISALDSVIRAVEQKEDSAVVQTLLQALKVELTKSLVPSPTSTGGASSSTDAKKKRAPSEFNVFVREAMTNDEVKALPSKQRMKAISSIWKLFKTPELEAVEADRRLAAAAAMWKETACDIDATLAALPTASGGE